MTSDEGRKEPNKIARWVSPLLGWCMIGHFVFLMGRTFLRGTPEDLFWISHVGTLLGGLGLVHCHICNSCIDKLFFSVTGGQCQFCSQVVAGIGSDALSDSGELAQGIVFGVSGRPERIRELFAVKFNSTRYLWDYFKYPNPDKPEITNCKHQITISKSQIRSIANCLVFAICYLNSFKKLELVPPLATLPL